MKFFASFFCSFSSFSRLLILFLFVILTLERRNVMTFTYRYRREILIICLGILILLVGTYFLLFQKVFKKKEDSDIVLNDDVSEIEVKDKKIEEVYYQVDIKGQINNPGIYTVKDGSRVIDVIKLAGDLTEIADTSVLNLSKKVTDEMVIIVYSIDEVASFTETLEKEKQEQEKCIKYSEIINDACISNEEVVSSSLKISINTATIEELMMLPGVGEVKAKAIISYREQIGGFKSIDEVKEVEGIGESLFDQIKENITI